MRRSRIFTLATTLLLASLLAPIGPALAGKPATQLTIPTATCSGGSTEATPTLQLSTSDRSAVLGGYVVFTWWDNYQGGDPQPNGVLDPQTVQVPKRVKQITGNTQGFGNDTVVRRYVVAVGYTDTDQQVFTATSPDLVFCTS